MKNLDDILKEYPLTPEEQEILDLKLELIGKLIELSKEKKIKQEKYAQLCGFKRSFIARMEVNPLRSMKVETLIKLAKAVNCKIKIEPITT